MRSKWACRRERNSTRFSASTDSSPDARCARSRFASATSACTSSVRFSATASRATKATSSAARVWRRRSSAMASSSFASRYRIAARISRSFRIRSSSAAFSASASLRLCATEKGWRPAMSVSWCCSRSCLSRSTRACRSAADSWRCMVPSSVSFRAALTCSTRRLPLRCSACLCSSRSAACCFRAAASRSASSARACSVSELVNSRCRRFSSIASARRRSLSLRTLLLLAATRSWICCCFADSASRTTSASADTTSSSWRSSRTRSALIARCSWRIGPMAPRSAAFRRASSRIARWRCSARYVETMRDHLSASCFTTALRPWLSSPSKRRAPSRNCIHKVTPALVDSSQSRMRDRRAAVSRSPKAARSACWRCSCSMRSASRARRAASVLGSLSCFRSAARSAASTGATSASVYATRAFSTNMASSVRSSALRAPSSSSSRSSRCPAMASRSRSRRFFRSCSHCACSCSHSSQRSWRARSSSASSSRRAPVMPSMALTASACVVRIHVSMSVSRSSSSRSRVVDSSCSIEARAFVFALSRATNSAYISSSHDWCSDVICDASSARAAVSSSSKRSRSRRCSRFVAAPWSRSARYDPNCSLSSPAMTRRASSSSHCVPSWSPIVFDWSSSESPPVTPSKVAVMRSAVSSKSTMAKARSKCSGPTSASRRAACSSSLRRFLSAMAASSALLFAT
mmetsp:Transcript_53528/g.164618  ORF Transcript_53528/g.164618 Transcript_53528/m.164618 type:complete len:692 (+) Transcript_53528:646-2721(+)